jgi:hypothetical protein
MSAPAPDRCIAWRPLCERDRAAGHKSDSSPRPALRVIAREVEWVATTGGSRNKFPMCGRSVGSQMCRARFRIGVTNVGPNPAEPGPLEFTEIWLDLATESGTGDRDALANAS